jgi:small subunit ribosomal protein S20
MAHHQSAKKSIRQTETRSAVNRSRKSRIHTFLRKVEEAIASGNKATAQEALNAAQPEIMVGVKKNLLKLNTASRKVSRLSARIKALVS